MDFSRPDLARRAYTRLLTDVEFMGVKDDWNANMLGHAVNDLMARDAEIANAIDNVQLVDAEIANRLRCAYMNMGAGMAAMKELRINFGDLRRTEAAAELADNPEANPEAIHVLAAARRACRKLLDREASYTLQEIYESLEDLAD